MKLLCVLVTIFAVCECQFSLGSLGSCRNRCGEVKLPCVCIKGCTSKTVCCTDFDQYCGNPLSQLTGGSLSGLGGLTGGSLQGLQGLEQLIASGNVRVITIGGPSSNPQSQIVGPSSNPQSQIGGSSGIFCSQPGQIASGRHSGNKAFYTVDDTITYSCISSDYTLKGTAVRKCGLDLSSSLSGTPRLNWLTPAPTCERSLSCLPRNCGFLPLCYRSNCPAYREATCKPSYCDCKEIYEVNGREVNCNDVQQPCEPRNCGFVPLCSQPRCPAVPYATCKPSYCDCKEIYEVNGREVNCNDVSQPCEPRNCGFVPLCSQPSCPAVPYATCKPSYCDCKEIYEVNGREVNCDEPSQCDPRNCGVIPLCAQSNCLAYPNAACKSSYCDCREWYEVDGRRVNCQEEPPEPCDPRHCGIVPLCYNPSCPAYPNAECKSSTCDCRQWYELNGQPVDCQVATSSNNDACRNNNCDDNADCISNGRNGYSCVCKSNYDGDGYQCRATDPCLENDCGENALCFPTGQFGFGCKCENGYEGDGYTCRGSCKQRCGSYDGPCRCTACDGFGSGCCYDYQTACGSKQPSFPPKFGQQPSTPSGFGQQPSFPSGFGQQFPSGFGQQRPQNECEKPGSIDHGSHSGMLRTNFPSGTTVYYRCDDGYVIEGASQIVCSYGFGPNPKWLPSVPTCKSLDPCRNVQCHQSSYCVAELGDATCQCRGPQWQCDFYCQKEPESYLNGELEVKSGQFTKSEGNLAGELQVEYEILRYFISVDDSEAASEHIINVAKLLDKKDRWSLGLRLQQQYFQSSDPLQQAMLAYFVGRLGDREWANKQFSFIQNVFSQEMDGPEGDVIRDIDQDLQIVYQEEEENGGNQGQQQQGNQAINKLVEAIEEEMGIIVRSKTAIGWSCAKDLVIYMGEILKAFKPEGLSAKLKELLKKKLIRRNPISRAIILYLLGKTDPAELKCSLRALEMIKKSVVGECRTFIDKLITSLKSKDKFKKDEAVKIYLKKIESLAIKKPEKACYFADQLLAIFSGMDPQKRPEIIKLLESLLQNKDTNSDAVLRYLIAKLDPNKARDQRDKMVAIQTVLKKGGKDYLVTKLLDNL